jgi:hypothetical protein
MKGAHMTWIFILLFLLGGLGIQLGNGWLAKNGVTLSSFAMVLPLLIIAQYFIASGYQGGTESFSFVRAHIIWTAVLIVATLAANFYLFKTIPGPLTLFALLLAGLASVIAVLGK